MSDYRDDLAAAHARIEQLEGSIRERDRLGSESKLLPRLRNQLVATEARVKQATVTHGFALFGAVIWFVIGALANGTAHRAAVLPPVFVAICVSIALSSSRRKRQLKDDLDMLRENIAEAESLTARANALVDRDRSAIRVEALSNVASTTQAASEPQGTDEGRDDDHQHAGSMRAG